MGWRNNNKTAVIQIKEAVEPPLFVIDHHSFRLNAVNGIF